MMASSYGEPPADEQLLVQYLLGALSEEEAERLDELSIADDEFAWRLRAAENDLVDAYVRGELSGQTLERFETAYVASPQRRQKVEFAGALLAFESRGSSADAGRAPARIAMDRERAGRSTRGPLGRSYSRWALAAAAMAALVAASYLFMENRRLREQMSQTQAARADLQQRAEGFRTELEQERSIGAALRDELARLRESLPPVRVPSLRPFVLLPMRRSASQIETVSIPRGLAEVPFRLVLESDDYQQYEVSLRDPATGQIVWRSGRLAARSDGPARYVEVELPSALLKQQNYSLDLAGTRASGPAEYVTSYPFRVVLE
jgi:hypothetical protein